MKPPTVTAQIPLELVDSVEDILDYLEERLIGHTPPALMSLLHTVQDQDTRPIIIVDDEGVPLRSEATTGADTELSAEQMASVAQYETWADSSEGQAEMEHEERFQSWQDENKTQTRADYDAWLSEAAARFQEERSAWWRSRNAALRQSLPAAATTT